ncbi:MAG: FeoA family protein [Nostoc sp.]
MFKPFSVTGCSLQLLRTGERGIVTFCKSQDETILRKVISMGIRPRTTITLKQKLPSLIIKVFNTDLALDLETIGTIYVRIIDN